MAEKGGRLANDGIQAVRRKGSRIVGEGTHTIPAAALVKAAGVMRRVADRHRR